VWFVEVKRNTRRTLAVWDGAGPVVQSADSPLAIPNDVAWLKLTSLTPVSNVVDLGVH
jgi:hypothetical protein